MVKQTPIYPTEISHPMVYFDGVVEWNLASTTDEYYDDILSKMVRNPARNGKFLGEQFDAELVWMDVDVYIELQIQILKYDDPAALAFDLALAGETVDSYVNDPEYNPFVAFEMSASGDHVQKLVNAIHDRSFAIPTGVLVYSKLGTLSEYQEGRHRSLALHIMGIPLMPVWIFRGHNRVHF